MSLPIPATGSAAGTSSTMMMMSPRELEALDAPLIALTNQCGGDLRKLLYAFFSFLNRRTDFYIVPSSSEEDLRRTGKHVRMGFPEGDAEKLLLAAFRQFPLRRMPPQGGVSSKKPATKHENTKEGSAQQEKLVSSSKEQGGPDKSPTANTSTSKATPFLQDAPNLLEGVRYTDEGLQIPEGNGGSTKRYKWTQSIDECSVMLGVPDGCRGKDLSVTIKPSSLSVRTKSPLQGETEPRVFLDGKLTEMVVPDESTWSLESGVLTVILYKKKKTFWKTVIVGDEAIDTSLVDSRRHIGEYDESTQAQIRKIIFEQDQARKGLPTTSSSEMEIPPLPPGVEYIDKKTLDGKK